MNHWDVVVIGAGAAGMMCALQAGYRGKRVLLLDHVKRPGKKILMSGGGRCNFTNMATAPGHFFSRNPHFTISALKRYTPNDFVEMVERHGIEPIEKAPGQLFCDDSSQPIVDMLLTECQWAGVELRVSTSINSVDAGDEGVVLSTSTGRVLADKLVIATGGLSIPTLGATGFAYDLARQYGLDVITPRPALVPLTLDMPWKERMAALSGVSAPTIVRCGEGRYRDATLLTHRGLSGPAILQASSHWQGGETVHINWLPDVDDLAATLKGVRQDAPKRTLGGWLGEHLPKRLAQALEEWLGLSGVMADYSNRKLETLSQQIADFTIKPAGTEGWRTAEVTIGGIDTRAISSKSFAVHDRPRLHFIGEALDVTGQLGGFNFQWAWASGYACAQEL
ncbi:NAD(P)/FAD-dependent oxidoreductase [Kushneria sp. TE3]|uniref:NAD(P)/FAD-dependent oxidoreductase n=1 Tax=Kushneria sp. TE3 TaxID=3449832 RepID=UPI003F688A79